MAKQSILKRFTNLIKAKINNWFDVHEDPVDELNRKILNYQEQVDQHETAVIDLTLTHNYAKVEYNEAVEEFKQLEHTVEQARALIKEAEKAGDTERVKYLTERAQLAYREYNSKKRNLEEKQAQLEAEAEAVQEAQAEHTRLKDEVSELKAKKDTMVSKLRLAQSKNGLDNIRRELDSSDGILQEIERESYKLEQSSVIRKQLEQSTDEHKLKEFQQEITGGSVDDDFADFLEGGSLESNIREIE